MKIKTLKYPWWFNVLFFCLTVVAPVALIVNEGLKAPNTVAGTTFKISFMVLTALLIAWIVIKKAIINNAETKLRTKQIALEHDYSTENGNTAKIKYLWHHNEIKLSLMNMLTTALYGGLACILLMGVTSALMKIKGIVIIVMTLYVVAYTVKFMFLIIKKGLDE